MASLLYNHCMFNSLQGTVNGKNNDILFLMTGGIEWEILMPASDLNELPSLGEICRVFIWLYHREDQMKLFGFSGETRRSTFLELLKVDGIGPKNALKILGGIRQEELEQALEKGDLARLESIPGLGKKTAQKMLLALKGKLISYPAVSQADSPFSDIINALSQMGYDKRSASEAVALAEKEIPLGLTQAEKEKLLFKNAIVYLAGK